jgi:hypothetical protein
MKTNYTDILLWTAKMLKTNFPNNNIYVDENEQDVAVPSFFIEVVPMSTKEMFDYIKLKTVNLIIEYVDRTARKEKKLQMIDDLSDLIGRGITVAQSDGSIRVLPVFNKIPTLSDATIMLVTLEYFDGKADPMIDEPDRDYDKLMGILALNVQAK